MRRFLGYGLAALLAYGVSMVLLFPAETLLNIAARRLPGFAVQEVEGRAVRGTARSVLLHAVTLESVSWYLDLLSLFKGRMGVRFVLEEPELRLDGVLAVSLNGQLSIAELGGYLPLPKAISFLGRPSLPVSGQVEIDVVELQLGERGLPRTAQGTLRLLGANTTLGRPLQLGDFNAEVHTEEQGETAIIRGTIKDTGGPLELTGNLTLTPEGGYRFNGQTAARDNNNAPLRQALSILGRPGTDGKWTIDLTGTLQF